MISKLLNNIPSIHKEGYPFILIALFITFIFFLFSSALGFIGSIISAWCIYFFRDPERFPLQSESAVLSPADGKVCAIKEVTPPAELELGSQKMIRVSIFLNVFNVHVNRIPLEGKVEKLHYHPGKFFNASLDKASEHNERQYVKIHSKQGVDIGVTQIAGLIARRIVCNLHIKQQVKAAERFGIIRFGSRTDLYLPIDSELLVRVGQTMVGGETIITHLKQQVKSIKNQGSKVQESAPTSSSKNAKAKSSVSSAKEAVSASSPTDSKKA